MGWFSTSFKRRIEIAVALEYVGGVPGGSPPSTTTTKDVEITIPPNFSAFWDNIQSNGFDAQVTLHDGITLTTFKRSSFNYANRELTIQIQNYTYDNKENSIGILYLYFDSPTAADASSSFSAGSTIPGKVFIGTPAGRIVAAEQTGSNLSNAPGATITKAVDEKVYVFFEYASLLNKMLAPYNNRIELETPKQIKIFSFDSSGTDSTARYDISETVFTSGYVGVMVQAGTNNSTFQIGGFLTTSLLQEIRLACFIEIKNKYPPS